MKIAKHFTTSDGTEFYTPNAAFNHAKTLKDKKVVSPGEAIIEVDINEIDVDAEVLVSTTDQLWEKSKNILVEGSKPGVIPTDLMPLSPEATQELIKTPDVISPATDAPAIDAPVTDALATDASATDTKKNNKPNTK
jgi:hypothetical protein